MPALGGNLFAVRQAVRNSAASIFYMKSPRLQKRNFTLPLQQRGHDIYSVLARYRGRVRRAGAGSAGYDKHDAVTSAIRTPQPHALGLPEEIGRQGGELRPTRGRLRLRRRGEESAAAGPSQDGRPQGKTPVPAGLHRPHWTFNTRGVQGLQVRQQDLRRAHQVSGDLFADFLVLCSRLSSVMCKIMWWLLVVSAPSVDC